VTEVQDRYDDEQGGKFYEHPFRTNPHTGDRRFISVTTVTDSLDKSSLKYWAAKGSSRDAMMRLPELVKAAMYKPCGDTYKKDGSACRRCIECAVHHLSSWHLKESKRRADEGSRTHDVVKWWSEHGEIRPHDEVIAPYVARFEQWVADFGVTPLDYEICETRVINPPEGYAGTLDGQIHLYRRTAAAVDFIDRIRPGADRVTVDIDIKTREKEGKQLYVEMPVQLAGYHHAPLLWLPDNSEVPKPLGDGGAILQLRPDGYHFEPVVVDEATYQAFLSFLAGKRWQMLHGAASIRVDSFPRRHIEEAPREVTEPSEPVGTAGSTPAVKKATKAAKKATPAKKAAPAKAQPQAAGPADDGFASAPASRVANATLDNIARTGSARGPGRVLADDEIPF